MKFTTWLNNFFEEKDIDMYRTFEFEIEGERHEMPVGCVYEAMLYANKAEQAKIKDTLVIIDFKNGDIYHYLAHLARGLAVNA